MGSSKSTRQKTKESFKDRLITGVKEEVPKILSELAVVGGVAALTAIVEYTINRCTEDKEE